MPSTARPHPSSLLWSAVFVFSPPNASAVVQRVGGVHTISCARPVAVKGLTRVARAAIAPIGRRRSAAHAYAPRLPDDQAGAAVFTRRFLGGFQQRPRSSLESSHLLGQHPEGAVQGHIAVDAGDLARVHAPALDRAARQTAAGDVFLNLCARAANVERADCFRCSRPNPLPDRSTLFTVAAASQTARRGRTARAASRSARGCRGTPGTMPGASGRGPNARSASLWSGSRDPASR